MKKVLSLILFISLTSWCFSQNNTGTGNHEANSHCLDCHGQKVYGYVNPDDGNSVRKLMPVDFRVDSVLFYTGAHHTFKCVDCHVPEYDSFPHPNQLRFEPMYACLDCHGGDETYAKYHFETIDEQFRKSVHSPETLSGFTCWNCHDPHSFRINQRTGETIANTIAYDNAVCMKCHFETGSEKMLLLANEKLKPMSVSHDWLPNQELHFKQVRCIECHAAMHDSLLIAHMVTSADSAVRQCKECHSRNSMLLSSWYRFQNIENRSKNGFVNGILLNEAYVIGASRNEILNILSLVLFGLTLGGILVHALFRLKINKRKSHE
ncbi:MAG TPA: hypothetical protein DCR43_04480 [Bacteroidales bacterium]|nr:MAG: hypothetical protein A2X11_01030 [Bacteroidetes bacterium GWE2_42_24]OFY27458.1 MAG: hypothetical protein A2X09_07195 [Bacteroidetes bacterium GWF2_43_11]HAQ65096.1 hypothetical protein [Bacteroidales bacterium]HBZ65973.1 hypothetical protein [Bacteroidales bacterium]